MPIIKPTVGRIVWFYVQPGEHQNLTQLGEQPFPAMVSYVHADDRVNLDVVDHEGRHIPFHNVYLEQDEGVMEPEGTTCLARWMPFQKGQAAKEKERTDVVQERAGQHRGQGGSVQGVGGGNSGGLDAASVAGRQAQEPEAQAGEGQAKAQV